MEYVTLVLSIILIEYLVFVMLVGAARHKSGIKAPAMSGDERLERALRVQMNTLEQLVMVIPAMWIFGVYVSPLWGAGLGLVFVIGRALYARGYMIEPDKRGLGFLIGMLATWGLLGGALYGSVLASL